MGDFLPSRPCSNFCRITGKVFMCRVRYLVAGPFHGLFLQLLAKGILELSIDTNEARNIGSDKPLAKHIVVKLG